MPKRYAISLPDGCTLLRQRQPKAGGPKVKRLLVLGLISLLAATAAYAHHSFARDYAEEKQTSLEGDVVSFEYRSPHAWVFFTANDGSGVLRKFGAEWANPRRLEQQGVGASDIKAGDHVIISGAPSRSASTYNVHLKSIRRPADGWTWPGSRGSRR
jgi:hypothetical protein